MTDINTMTMCVRVYVCIFLERPVTLPFPLLSFMHNDSWSWTRSKSLVRFFFRCARDFGHSHIKASAKKKRGWSPLLRRYKETPVVF